MTFSQAEGNIVCLGQAVSTGVFLPKRIALRIENGKGDISSLQLISLHEELLQEMRIFI